MRMKLFVPCSFFMGISALAHTDAPLIDDSLALRQSVSIESVRAHQYELQQIATAHNGNRVAGSLGFEASVAYVKSRMEHAGYSVRLQEFSFLQSEDNNPPVLVKIGTTESSFEANKDFSSMSSLGYAEVQGEIEAVDLKIPSTAPNDSTSGCEPEDFRNFKRGNIALIQRGTCTFHVKVQNAIQAGALGVILFNEGNPGRKDLVKGRLDASFLNFPVVGARYEVGEKLYAATIHGPCGTHALLRTDILAKRHTVNNVIAESKNGDENKVVVVGAHLDSVRAGPGMNDNGSGSATILSIAEKYAELGIVPKNKLRFIWFAAEEYGLLGSEHYVESLTRAEQKQIHAMLNFDMLGSSNYARFVYDGDNSGKSALNARSGPEGSAYIERLFLDYFSALGLANHPTAFDGRSDYGPFIQVGIPAGGLFAGAEGFKSAEMARIYGGRARYPYDPCYHRTCDNYDNTGETEASALARKSLDELSDAAAHVVWRLSNLEEDIRPPQQFTEPSVEFEYKGDYLVR